MSRKESIQEAEYLLKTGDYDSFYSVWRNDLDQPMDIAFELIRKDMQGKLKVVAKNHQAEQISVDVDVQDEYDYFIVKLLDEMLFQVMEGIKGSGDLWEYKRIEKVFRKQLNHWIAAIKKIYDYEKVPGGIYLKHDPSRRKQILHRMTKKLYGDESMEDKVDEIIQDELPWYPDYDRIIHIYKRLPPKIPCQKCGRPTYAQEYLHQSGMFRVYELVCSGCGYVERIRPIFYDQKGLAPERFKQDINFMEDRIGDRLRKFVESAMKKFNPERMTRTELENKIKELEENFYELEVKKTKERWFRNLREKKAELASMLRGYISYYDEFWNDDWKTYYDAMERAMIVFLGGFEKHYKEIWESNYPWKGESADLDYDWDEALINAEEEFEEVHAPIVINQFIKHFLSPNYLYNTFKKALEQGIETNIKPEYLDKIREMARQYIHDIEIIGRKKPLGVGEVQDVIAIFNEGIEFLIKYIDKINTEASGRYI
jgi:hypothetical protein